MRMRLETESFMAENINRLVNVCTCSLKSVYFWFVIACLAVPACARRSRAPSCCRFVFLRRRRSLAREQNEEDAVDRVLESNGARLQAVVVYKASGNESNGTL